MHLSIVVPPAGVPANDTVNEVIDAADTTTTLAVTSPAATATVTTNAPGVGTPTGSVDFSVNGTDIGSRPLVDGVATYTGHLKPGQTYTLAAAHQGTTDFTASSTSASRSDPTIKAKVSSTTKKAKYGWYRSSVTVSFTCTTNGAPLVWSCPKAVTLTKSKAAQSVSRTITAPMAERRQWSSTELTSTRRSRP